MPDLRLDPSVPAAPPPEGPANGRRGWWTERHPNLVALGFSALSIALMFALRPWAERVPIVFCAWAVMPTFLYGGFVPGALVTVLTCAAADYFFIPPVHSLWIADANERVFFFNAFLLLLGGSAVGGLFRGQLTLRGKRELALEQSEARYRGLLEQASDAIFVADPTSRIRIANRRACELLGYEREELTRMKISDLIAPEDLATQPVRWEELRGKPFLIFERRMVKRDGTRFHVEVSVRMLPDGSAQAIARDVTQRRREQEALRLSEAELRALVEASSDVVIVLDRDGRYLKIPSASPQFQRWSTNDVVGHTLHDLLPRDQADQLLEVVRSALDTRRTVALDYSIPIGEKDVWFRATVSPMLEDRAVLIARDITRQHEAERELELLEEQLRHSQKMDAVGRLAGGIAHDFNNLLTVIGGNSELVLEGLPASDPQRDGVAEIRRAADRAAALTRQLLAFSRKQVMQPSAISLNTVVHEVEKMLARVIGEDVTLQTELDPELGLMRGDQGQLEQVLLNLAVNARDAMRQGGRLRIVTRNRAIAAGADAIVTGAKPGEYVTLQVSDTGHGMDAETQAKIFEPFFTTKSVGRGTGLGLSTVYGIVQQSGGAIQVQSAPAQGATFTLLFPRLAADALVPRAPAAHVVSNAGTPTQRGRILLVEDEDAVRRLARLALTREGHEVLEARNGAEAIELAERGGPPLDLLVTDVVMPGMSGRELADRLSEKQPGLRVLFLSGYASGDTERLELDAGRRDYLHKPFTAATLSRAVNETLERRAPTV